jgi:hypothetical protein
VIRAVVAGVLVALLALTHFMAYRAGRAVVRAEVAQRGLDDVHEARKLESRRATLAAEASQRARERERGLVADAAALRAEHDGLRDALDAANRAAQADAETCRRYAGAATAVVAAMARAGEDMARAADQCHSDLTLLREAPP